MTTAPTSESAQRSAILVIEDDPECRELLRVTLSHKGYPLHFANSGRAGFDAARGLAPELILLDLGLPDINGVDVCGLLRRDPRTKNIPVMLMSGLDNRSGVFTRAAPGIGADGFLPKPFGENELLINVRRLLERKEPASVGLLTRGRICVDLASYSVTVSGKTVRVGPKRFELLSLLLKHPEGASHEVLMKAVWKGAADADTLKKTVERLRKSLGVPEAIVSIPGGYKLVG